MEKEKEISKQELHITFHDRNAPQQLADYLIKIIAEELVEETGQKTKSSDSITAGRK